MNSCEKMFVVKSSSSACQALQVHLRISLNRSRILSVIELER